MFFGTIAPKKYTTNRKINPCNRVIFSCLRDYKNKLHELLYATFLYATPEFDLIITVITILSIKTQWEQKQTY